MAEEFEPFDPQHFDVLPHDIEEIDLCIKYANSVLNTEASRSFRKWRDQIQVSSLIDLSHFSPLSIDIPAGSLFYPCSGNDFNLPIEVFSNCVSEFHFADAFSRSYGHNNLVKNVVCKEVPWVGRIALGETSQFKKVIDKSKAIFHCKDGLLTLLDDIVDLSIFFYRGDSTGEGGSNQLWQGPVLLDYVLMRIQDGGLLCADDSNGFGPLFNELRKSKKVDYRNVKIQRLDTENLSSLSNMKIWQVTKI